MFASSLYSSDSRQLIEIRAIRLGMTVYEEKAAAAEEELKSTAGKVRKKNVSSPLGRGNSFTFGAKGEMTLVEHFPLGNDYLLRIRLRGTPERFEAAVKEYTRARKTLKFVID